MISTQGLAPSLFDAVGEFVERVEAWVEMESAAALSKDHPLALVVASALEGFSTHQLGQPIVDFSRQSKNSLTRYRRDLEGSGDAELAQKLLFAFEEICEVVRYATYGEAPEDARSEFFQSSFPNWLDRVAELATAVDDGELLEHVRLARERYGDLTQEWWLEV